MLDRPKLEGLSCECYGVVKKEIDQLLHYVPQRQVITNPDSISVGKPVKDSPGSKKEVEEALA